MSRDAETRDDGADTDDARPSAAPAGAPAAVGQIGRFVVLRPLGSGGMGVVYLAYDNDLDRKLAIKVLRRRHDDDHATALRMQREAQAMARIAHPNVLRVYEVGVEGGRLFVAMEYVEGETLGAALARRGAPVDRAGLREVLALFASAGAGLAAAHDAGLVHRDFKPDNVLLDTRGGVRVADFGLARAADGPAPSDSLASAPVDRSALALDLTATRAVVGTPAYMAPEQHAGLALGVAADIFAFCVSLHEGLYGVRPFAGDSVAALASAAAREQVLPAPAGSPVPAWLRAVVLRGLRSDPDARWPSMHALLAALADDPFVRRRRRLWAATAALTLVTVAVLVVSALRGAARQLDIQAAQVGEIRGERDEARERAEIAARQARDLLRMAVLRDVEDDPTSTLLVLGEVEDPAATPGWLATAQSLLHRPVSAAILRGAGSPVLAAAFVGEAGEHVAVHTRDGRLRLSRRDGRGAPVEVDLGVGLPALVTLGHDRLAAPIAGQRIGVWRVDAGALEPVGELTGAPARVSGLAPDPSGRRLVALGARSSRAVVWDLVRGERSAELGCADEPILDADISRDGAHLLLAHEGSTCCVFDLDGGAAPVVVRGRSSGEFLPDGDIALFDDERAELWSWRAGRRPRLLAAPPELFRWGLDPSGRYVASVDFDDRLRLHALRGGDDLDLGRAAEDPDHITDIALFSADGAWLAAAGARQITLWRTDDLQRRAVLRAPELREVKPAFSADDRWFLAGTASGDVHVWRLDDLERALHLETGADVVHGITQAAGDGAVAALADSAVAWWQIPGDLAPVRRHAPDWAFVPAVDDDARVAVVSVTGQGDLDLDDPAAGRRTLRGHRRPVTGLDFSRDGRWLLSASHDATARLWDLRAGDGSRLLADHGGPVVAGALTDDATRAATLGGDGSLRLWDLRGPDPLRGDILLATDRGGAHSFAFSPDGRWLVGLTRDPAAYLWDIDGGGPPRRLAVDDAPNEVCWDPSGRWLALAGADGTAEIWDPHDERPPLVHRGHGAPVTQIACAPDGRSVATVSDGRRVRLWPSDRSGDAELHVVDAGRVAALAFTRDGRDLLIGTYSGILTRWTPRFEFTAAADDVLARLRARTTACLTARQREWLLREPPARARDRFTACERRFARATDPALAP